MASISAQLSGSVVHTKQQRPEGWRRLRRGVAYLLLLGWGFLVFFPIYWTIITAFKQPIAINQGPTYVPWLDFQPTLDAWNEMLFGVQGPRVRQAFRNGAIISLTTGVLALILGSMAGYGLARFHYRWGRWRNDQIAFWFISQRMMPPIAAVLAFLIMYRWVGLLDSLVGMILAYVAFNLPLVVWIMRDFFAQMPRELEESAQLDGASPLRAFLSIALPLAAPGLVTSFILVFIFTWNEYLLALILTFENSVTVPLLLASQVTSIGVQWWKMAVLAVMSIVPSVICAVVLERYIVRGLFSGALK